MTEPAPTDAPMRLTDDDLDSFKVGSVVRVMSSFVGFVPYKRTRKGWCTFSPRTGRANGQPLSAATLVKRGAWLLPEKA